MSFFIMTNAKYKVQSAGYSGYSKSNNALDAEEQGKFPLSKACVILAEKLKWPAAKAKAFLLSIGTKEYHHTSSKYNKTLYYDVSDDAIADLKDEIASFQYKAATPKPSTTWFKCWNMEREKDIRKWDWKLTNREGNNCYPIGEVKKQLNVLLEQWLPKQNETHKAKKRIADETVTEIKKILSELG